MRKSEPNLVWDRPDRLPRPVPVPLSRASVVAAALALADAEGLSAVTLRKVGSALGAGPMRLYGFVATKDDLLTLMVDAVYEKMLCVSGASTVSGRQEVARLAHALRNAALQHPWFISLVGGRPHQGPNALAFLEAMLAAVAQTIGPDRIDVIFEAAKMIEAFIIGAVRHEAAELAASLESGLTLAEWQDQNWPFLERMIATGRYPFLARVVHEMDRPSPDTLFGRGLECVIDGIAQGIST